MTNRKRTGKQPNNLRIIGGQWRGRRLQFPDQAGLRPTPDRVRETLFNWLAPAIYGARCLDLFSGSGALGLEALSRQAAKVTFVDQSRAAITAIQQHLALLQATPDQAEVVNADCRPWLERASDSAFDIVFIDPPFRQGMAAPTCTLLTPHLRPGSLVYLETEAELEFALPEHWHLSKQKVAGQVAYALYEIGAQANDIEPQAR